MRLNRAQSILQNEGIAVLLKAIMLFLIRPIYSHTVFLLSIRYLEGYSDLNEADYRLTVDNLVFKVVSSNQQADELEKESYSFRFYPTDFNYDRQTYKDWLDKGAIVFCAFVDKELAAIRWAITSQKVQDAIETYPIKLNYEHEVFLRGAWTNPKYRGQGLSKYLLFFIVDPWLAERGVTNARGTTSPSNTTGLGLQRAWGSANYGKGHLYKILWLKFWREVYFNNDIQKYNINTGG